MSEVGGTRPDVPKLHWADGGTPNTTTEPNESKKDDGFPFEDVPPAAEENWWRKRTGEIANWIDGSFIREFSTLAEAIPFISAPRCFRVHPPDAAMNARGATVFSTQGTGGAVAVIDVATDGFYVFYAQGDTVYATSPASLTDEWSYQPVAASNIIDLFSDGFRVYALIPYQAGDDEVYLLNPTTGAKVVGISLVSSTYAALAANGVWLTVLVGNFAYFFDTLDGTPVEQGNYNHGATLAAVALDAENAYIGGTQGTGSFDVRAVKLSTQAVVWSVAMPTTTAVTVKSIAADGDFVYVGTDRKALTAGGNANVFCLNRYTGAVVWTADLTVDDTNTNHIFVDDRFVYPSMGTQETYFLDKRNGQTVFYSTTLSGRDCDGLSVCGAATNNGARIWRGNSTRVFMRADGEDPNRRPFHKYAVPIDGGI